MTDEEGKFVLKTGGIQTDSVWLKVESLGYRDTIIGVNPDENLPLFIMLSPHIFVLPQVNVSDTPPLKEKVIGIPQGQVLKDRASNELGLLPSNSAGLSSDAFVKMKDRETGILKSIEFYLIQRGYPETPFILRILETRQKLEPNRMYSQDLFNDLVKEPIIVKGHVGWNRVPLEEYNIPIPRNDFIILFTPIDSGPQYKWGDNGKEWYGMVLGIYRKKNVKELFWALRAKGTYSYDDTPFQRKLKPAIVLRYLAQ